MICNEVSPVLEAYASAALTGPVRAAVVAHLEDCRACCAELARIQALPLLLRSQGAPPPPSAERLVRGAVARAQQRRHWQFTSLAAAATLLVGVAIGLTLRPPAGSTEHSEEVTLTAGAPTTVALHVSATRPIEDVRFELAIPEGFELAGHEGKRHVAWSGRLEPGKNRLKLRLLGAGGSAGVLVATVRYDDQARDIRVLLRTSPEASAGLIALSPWAPRTPSACLADCLAVVRTSVRSLA